MWLFFTIWNLSNTFCNFSGCNHLIFYVFFSFPTPYSKLFYDQNSQRYSEMKKESRKRLLSFPSEFGFVQTYFMIYPAGVNQFLNVLISLDLYFISFPTPYSKLFYNKNYRRYSKKNTSENDGSAFLRNLGLLKHITQFLRLKSSDVKFFISLDLSVH